jgi:hypothetical protein
MRSGNSFPARVILAGSLPDMTADDWTHTERAAGFGR